MVTKDFVTKEELQRVYGELYILEYYLGSINFKKNYVNPIRPDRTPSGRFYRNGDNVIFKDFASKEHSFNCFDYVMQAFNLSFTEALRKIADDLQYKPNAKPVPRMTLGVDSLDKDILTKSKEFIIKHRSFNKFDLKYWSQFNITEQILNLFNVQAVSKFDTKDLKTGEIYNSYKDLHYDPCYSYTFNHKSVRYNKLYRPISKFKNVKWRTNCNAEVIQGYEQLQFKSNALFITSSLKDVMTLHSLGFEAIAPQSENVDIDKSLIDDLLFAYRFIVIFYDYDSAGKKAAKSLKSKINNKKVRSIFTKHDKYKDISDYIKSNSAEITKKHVMEQLRKIKITKL